MNALFKKGQSKGHILILLSQQFAAAGGGAFTTPYMNDNIGGFSSGGAQIPNLQPGLYFEHVTSSPVNVPGVSNNSDNVHILAGLF